jgi:cobalamin biosynthesis Co2+ chelatase CbiK
MPNFEQPVIVISAYGTGNPEAQAVLEAVDAQAHQRFPGYEIRWALTADWLIKRLREAGQTTLFAREEPIQNLAGLFTELKAAGYTRAAVQCLLVHEGTESQRVFDTPTLGIQVEYGQPLLEDAANIDGLIEAEAPQFGGEGELTIVVGHGNDADPRSNIPFKRIDEKLRANYRDAFVTMVHGSPSPDEVLLAVKRPEHRTVVFVPLMITNSEHISKDVLGEKPTSWRSRLELPYRLGPSLAQTPAVMEVYFKSLERVLAKF